MEVPYKAEWEATIATACEEHQQEHWADKSYRAFLSIDIDGRAYFVKYGDYETLWPEIQTQLYVSTHAESLVGTPRPRIPKVLHYFQRDTKIKEAYLVMERIKLSHSPRDLSERMLEAIMWLATVPAPEGHVLGPLGGGRIRHSFFKNYTAPYHFPSVQALERYVNRGHKILSRMTRHRQDRVSITNERLIFTQPDMHDSNFAVDEGKTVLLDFGDIAWLPESFAPIIEVLELSGGSNMAFMREVAYSLGMVCDPKLDANGFSKASEN